LKSVVSLVVFAYIFVPKKSKKVLDFSSKRNSQGYKVVYAKNPEKCNMCGICYLMCPDVVFVKKT